MAWPWRMTDQYASHKIKVISRSYAFAVTKPALGQPLTTVLPLYRWYYHQGRYHWEQDVLYTRRYCWYCHVQRRSGNLSQRWLILRGDLPFDQRPANGVGPSGDLLQPLQPQCWALQHCPGLVSTDAADDGECSCWKVRFYCYCIAVKIYLLVTTLVSGPTFILCIIW